MVKKRTTMKALPILFHGELAPSYSTDDSLPSPGSPPSVGPRCTATRTWGLTSSMRRSSRAALPREVESDHGEDPGHPVETRPLRRPAQGSQRSRRQDGQEDHGAHPQAWPPELPRTADSSHQSGDICNQRPLGIQHQVGAELGHAVLTPS